jgi:hypothetical protein
MRNWPFYKIKVLSYVLLFFTKIWLQQLKLIQIQADPDLKPLLGTIPHEVISLPTPPIGRLLKAMYGIAHHKVPYLR